MCHTQLQPIPPTLTYLLGMKQCYLDILASHRDQSNVFLYQLIQFPRETGGTGNNLLQLPFLTHL